MYYIPDGDETVSINLHILINQSPLLLVLVRTPAREMGRYNRRF